MLEANEGCITCEWALLTCRVAIILEWEAQVAPLLGGKLFLTAIVIFPERTEFPFTELCDKFIEPEDPAGGINSDIAALLVSDFPALLWDIPTIVCGETRASGETRCGFEMLFVVLDATWTSESVANGFEVAVMDDAYEVLDEGANTWIWPCWWWFTERCWTDELEAMIEFGVVMTFMPDGWVITCIVWGEAKIPAIAWIFPVEKTCKTKKKLE